MKRSREYRFEQRERVIKNRIKLCSHKRHPPQAMVDEPSRMDKKRPFDCGRANCQMCRTHKKEWDKIKKMKFPLEDNEDG